MELLTLLIPIALLIGVVWLYFVAASALNARCLERFGYEPVTFWKSCLIAVPFIICLIAFVMDHGVFGLNVIVGLIVGCIIIMLLWLRLLVKTSLLESLGAISLLIIAGIFFFLIVILFVFLRLMAANNPRRVYIEE